MSVRRETPEEGHASTLAEVRGLEGRVEGLERAVDVLGKRSEKGFSDIHLELKAISSRIASAPNYRIGDVLDVILKAGGLLAMCATAIIWISTSIAAGSTATIQTELKYERERTVRLERAVERLVERLTPQKVAGLQ